MKTKGLFIKAITFMLAIVTFASVLVGCADSRSNIDSAGSNAQFKNTILSAETEKNAGIATADTVNNLYEDYIIVK